MSEAPIINIDLKLSMLVLTDHPGRRHTMPESPKAIKIMGEGAWLRN
jgi:hypothetical protein